MRGNDGYILVAVLGTMLVLAALIASASLVAHSALRGARADDGVAGLDGITRGGLEFAAYQLFSLHLPFAEVSGRPLRLAGGSATSSFTDEAGRIDVNAADPAVLLGSFRAAGIDEEKAAALVSRTVILRDIAVKSGTAPAAPDAVAKPNGGAPTSTAPGAPAPNGLPRGSFRSVADFIAFANLDRDEAASLQTLLTTSNPDGKIDALTANRRVLMAIPNMSDALADSVLAERKAGAEAVERVKSALSAQALYMKFEPGPCYGVTVTAHDSMGRSATRHGIIAASRSPGEPFYTLAWE